MTGKWKWVEGGLRGHRVHMLIGAAGLTVGLAVSVVVATVLLSEANRRDYAFENRSIAVTMRYKSEPDSQYVNVRDELETFRMLVELFEISTPHTENPALNTLLLENIKAGLDPIAHRNMWLKYLHEERERRQELQPIDSASVTRRGSAQADTTVLRSVTNRLLQVTSWPERDSVNIDLLVVSDKKPFAKTRFNCAQGYNVTFTISTGILALIATEDEMGAVLGHELGHIDQLLAVMRELPSGVKIPLPCSDLLVVQSYLDNESFQDHLSLEFMRKSGYELRAIVNIFEKGYSVLQSSMDEVPGAVLRCRLIKLKKSLGIPTDEVCAPYLRLPTW